MIRQTSLPEIRIIRQQNNRAFFVGQDIDLNCARMCALNLMFFNLDGLVVWGNTLTNEVHGAWETRRSVAFGGTLRAVDSEQARAFLASYSGTDAKAEKPDQAINKPLLVAENRQLSLFLQANKNRGKCFKDENLP